MDEIRGEVLRAPSEPTALGLVLPDWEGGWSPRPQLPTGWNRSLTPTLGATSRSRHGAVLRVTFRGPIAKMGTS